MYLIFDIGGSSTKTAIIDDEGKIVVKGKITAQKTMKDFLIKLQEKVDESINKYGIKGIGISSPGRVDSLNGEVLGLTALGYLNEINFCSVLKEKYNIPIAIINDANAAALAEMTYAKVTEKNVCFFIIGSGVGGAVIRDGKLVYGRRNEAGEFGYMYLKRVGNKLLNLSQLATMQNAAKRFRKKFKKTIYAKDLFNDYLKGISPQKEIVEEAIHYLCVGLYNVQYSIDSEVIYIGGAISQDERYIDEIKEYLKKDQFKDADIKIRAVTYFNDNNLLGAYVHLKQMMKEGSKLCLPSE